MNGVQPTKLDEEREHLLRKTTIRENFIKRSTFRTCKLLSLGILTKITYWEDDGE